MKFNINGSITLKNFIITIIHLPFLIGIIYFSGFFSLLQFILLLFLGFLIFFPFSYLWRKHIKKEELDLEDILTSFLFKTAILIFIIFVSVWSFSYYYNNVSKAKLPLYVLTNGEKRVEFQTMSHIATKNFYDIVKDNIINAKKRGFVLYYEGVKIKKDENNEEKLKQAVLNKYNKDYKKLLDEFNKALGIKFDKELYKSLSLLYGLVPQNNKKFLNLVNNKDYNVDLDLDTIIKIYKEKIANKKQKETIFSKYLKKIENSSYGSKDILKKFYSLNKRELKLFRWVNKAIMSFIMQKENFSSDFFSILGKQDIFSVILDERNKNLAKKIQKSKDKKIFVIYGKMHFSGTFKELRKMDKRWRIINKKDFFPLD